MKEEEVAVEVSEEELLAKVEATKELTPGSCYLVKITDPVRFLVEHRVAYPARPDSE